MIKAASLIGAGLVLGGLFMPLECTFSIGPVCLQRQSIMSDAVNLSTAALNRYNNELASEPVQAWRAPKLGPTSSETLTQNNPAVAREVAIIQHSRDPSMGYSAAYLACHRDMQCLRAACEAGVETGWFNDYSLCDPDKQ